MPVSPSRAAAFKILLRVEKERSFATELLHSSQYQALSSQDHGLATELVMGVLRWRSLLDRQIAKASTLPLQRLDIEVLGALRLATYQLLFLDRVPASAAVNESVEIVKHSGKRSAMPFANAVLRKVSLRLTEVKNELLSFDAENMTQLADSSSHPLWLVERWKNQYGDSVVKTIVEYDQKIPESSIRLGNGTLERELQREGVQLAPGKLVTSARRVLSGDVTNTAAFRQGKVSIQDEASQLVALLVGEGVNIFDCCAAPGGKTRIIAERNPNARVVALELHPNRARLLRRLVPANNVSVIAGDAADPPSEDLFDRVLVDVPCSGTGTLARNPEIKWRLTPADITDLHTRQAAILQSSMRRVVPGGRLVYSTCSLEREENSDVVEKALSADKSFHVVNCLETLEALQLKGELAVKEGDLHSLTSGNYLHTIPGVYSTDGFFAAVLQKAN